MGNQGYKDENGVPLALVDLTDKNGKKLSNQNNAAAGSYFKYNTYFKITKQGNNAKLGNMSFIVPESKGAGYGFWVSWRQWTSSLTL